MKPVPLPARRAGFSMLEILVVMSIMVLIIGMGFASFTFLDSEDPFDKPAQRLTEMSKYSMHASVLQHRSMVITFEKEGFGVLGGNVPGGAYYSVPEGMKVLISRLGAKRWEKAEGHFWRFGEQGICEPIKIRFESASGFRDLTFHPLTGAPVD